MEGNMLVLSRKVGQDIYIGDDIIVTVMEIVGKKVRIGVKAPLDMDVDRPEIRKKKQRQQIEEEYDRAG